MFLIFSETDRNTQKYRPFSVTPAVFEFCQFFELFMNNFF